MSTNMKIITNEHITHQVSLAVDHPEMYLPVGEEILVEYLSDEDDGIFETPRSWAAFVRGNFLGTGANRDYFQPIKESTIKRWCYDKNDYIHKFAARVGVNGWVKVDPEDIELEYDYTPLYSQSRDIGLPTSIEITVKARFKKS